mmetsp:Transcript_16168/g.34991  ORF Transcript_16168/g.34991 Transcript_16168/m.34991 type:complete len:418 (-) Transcript_16168:99-1352(-)
MAGSSSSSTSTSDKKDKKKKHDKGKKQKSKKEEKKSKKKSKKQEKKEKRSEQWDFDREDAVRHIGQLLLLDSRIDEELLGVFEALDGGDSIQIDGLQNRQARKKLRHLLKTLKMSEGESGFKTASKKVSFTSIFKTCVAEARKNFKGPTEQTLSSAAATHGQRKAAVDKYAAAAPSDADAASAASPRAPEGEMSPAPAASFNEGPSPLPAVPDPTPASRRVGPQLPGASVGPAQGGENSSDDEDEDGGAGPRVEGEERMGVDLNDMPRHTAREEWMSTPHASIAAAFGEGEIKRDKYEVKRSKEDQEAFEKLFKARGPSLLQQKMENKFAGHEDEMEAARKRKNTTSDLWGMGVKEQAMGSAGATASAPTRRSFDPDKDMADTPKPMSRDDFSKLVENSVSGLSGRFGRGNVATSFL